ncbi:hypothetical protein L1049_005482 [Liquidambar formosana]|uniref:Gnk2-homologous domain-containing protein n=1 Tax=Liquidambar formosana TaxID=63359 RepID=A0AAP0RQ78_LIQFO
MGSAKPFSFLSLAFSFLTISGFFVQVKTSDNTNFVYRGCAEQKFQDSAYSQTLTTLFDSLVSQSANTSFSSTTAGEGQSAIFGLFQCRGDLTTSDCYNCVSKLPAMADKLCGKSIAARIQLNGCYMRYEISGFKQVPATEFLYRVCGSTRASGSEFEGKRDTAFDMVEKGVEGGTSGGFYTGSYESVYVLGQCEEDLASGDCGDCVKAALDRVKVECVDSISGQIYLHKCYISYSYYPNGVASKSSSSGTEQGTEKTVAIVVGGVAALGFGIAFVMFVRSVFKKRGGKHAYGG